MGSDRQQQTNRRLGYDGGMSSLRPIVILGTGYTGRWIQKVAREQSLPILASSRRPEQHLRDTAQTARIQFDLDQPSTWSALPLEADLIWTFPAVPLDQVQAFARYARSQSRRLVVLGSTSAYDRGGEPTADLPPWIDETCPINIDLPRVQGEEYLRTQQGGIILRVAGIYGPHRNPVEWIRHGRVGPTNKYVNLVHVEDLAALCLLALRTGRAGDSYNISDGRPRRWADVCAEVSSRWGIVSPREASPGQPGKRICNRKALETLQYTLRHPDLYHALATLQQDTGERISH